MTPIIGTTIIVGMGVSVAIRLPVVGLVVGVTFSLLAMAGCAPTVPQYTASAAEPASATPQPSPAPTPNSTSTVTGGMGPLGLVKINQTFSGVTGLTITLQEATTTWLPADQFGSIAATMVRVVGLRVVIDDHLAKERGITLWAWPPDAHGVPIDIRAHDDTNTGMCVAISEETDAAAQARDLAAIGGDVAFAFDEVTNSGEGWLLCGTNEVDDSAFGNGYIISTMWIHGNDQFEKHVSDPANYVVVVP